MIGRFIVWGTDEVPQLLFDYGAILATDSELAAADVPDDALFNWVIAINAKKDELERHAQFEPRINGFRYIDSITQVTCSKVGEWNNGT